MTHDMDIVEDIFLRVKNALGIQSGCESAALLNDVETQIRQVWGGTEPYIGKKRKRDRIKEQALSDLNHGAPVHDVMSKTGISRAQVYRLLKCKK